MLFSAITFIVLSACEDGDVAVLVAEIDLAVDHHRRAPDRREHVVRPERLAGLDVEACRKPLKSE